MVAVELEQAVGHHGQVGHHVVLAEETAERLHHLGDVGIGRVHQFVELALGLFAPMPRVFKRRDLRLGIMGRDGALRCPRPRFSRFGGRFGKAAGQGRGSASGDGPAVHPYLRRFEQEVVVALGVERRVEVDEVHGFVRDGVAQDVEIVAEEELVHLPRRLGKQCHGVNSRLRFILLVKPEPAPVANGPRPTSPGGSCRNIYRLVSCFYCVD